MPASDSRAITLSATTLLLKLRAPRSEAVPCNCMAGYRSNLRQFSTEKDGGRSPSFSVLNAEFASTGNKVQHLLLSSFTRDSIFVPNSSRTERGSFELHSRQSQRNRRDRRPDLRLRSSRRYWGAVVFHADYGNALQLRVANPPAFVRRPVIGGLTEIRLGDDSAGGAKPRHTAVPRQSLFRNRLFVMGDPENVWPILRLEMLVSCWSSGTSSRRPGQIGIGPKSFAWRWSN
jgi:hypothetical protein